MKRRAPAPLGLSDPGSAGGWRAGELASLTGVSTDTLRHYERKGVLPRPGRLPNGYRRYPGQALERVRMVRAALALGFTLDELARVLGARAGDRPPCREVRALAAAKLAAAEARIAELERLVATLRELLVDWDHRLAEVAPGTAARLLERLPARPAPPSPRLPPPPTSRRQRKP